MDKYPLTVIDVETGGLNPQTDALLSIGLVSMETGREMYLEVLPFPGAMITDQALEINGFTREGCGSSTRWPEREALQQILSFFIDEPRTLAGENPSFDSSFLRALFDRWVENWIFGHRTFDTHTLAMAHMIVTDHVVPVYRQKSAINLDIILRYCGYEERNGYHNALEDARLEAAAIRRLLNTFDDL